MNYRKTLVLTVTLLTLSGFASAQIQKSGGTVFVGNESGEITVSGGTVIVNGAVDGNLTVFAGNLFVNENVTGDVNSFSGNTEVSGSVDGRLTSFSGNIVLDQGSKVGFLEANGGNVVIDGTVDRDAVVNAGSLIIGESGLIRGNLNYSSEEFVNNGIVDGEINKVAYEPLIQGNQFQIGFAVLSFLFRFTMGAIILLLAPKYVSKVFENVRGIPGKSILAGLAAIMLTPVILLLVFITLIGIPVALIGIAIFLITVWIASILGSYSVPRAFTENKWIALLTGLIMWELVGLIPIVGGFIQFLVTVLGLGAITIPSYTAVRERFG